MLKAHEKRVVNEKTELDQKMTKLQNFIGTSTYLALGSAEQSRLNRQVNAMLAYSNILGERIQAFTKE